MVYLGVPLEIWLKDESFSWIFTNLRFCPWVLVFSAADVKKKACSIDSQDNEKCHTILNVFDLNEFIRWKLKTFKGKVSNAVWISNTHKDHHLGVRTTQRFSFWLFPSESHFVSSPLHNLPLSSVSLDLLFHSGLDQVSLLHALESGRVKYVKTIL